MSEPLLLVSPLSFQYPKSNQTLHFAAFSLRAGEKIFIEAPSGAGKTTLLSLIAGVLVPQKGNIQFLGKPFSSLPESQRDYLRGRYMGYIFQQFNLLPQLTARQNLLLLETIAPHRFAPMSLPEKKAQWTKLEQTLKLTPFLDQKAKSLSSGQVQRVAVMRALLGRPVLLLADEPTSALDSENRDNFLTLLEKLCAEEGIGLIFASHDTTLKSKFDYCLKLAAGEVSEFT